MRPWTRRSRRACGASPLRALGRRATQHGRACAPRSNFTPALAPHEAFALLHPRGPAYFVRDCALDAATVAGVRDFIERLDARGALRPAAMNRDASEWRATDIRGDKIAWLSEEAAAVAASAPMRRVLRVVHDLRAELARVAPSLGLGSRTSIQVTHYVRGHVVPRGRSPGSPARSIAAARHAAGSEAVRASP